MKNIQVIDGADNCVYDIFAATRDEFALIFPDGQDIAFIGEVQQRCSQHGASAALDAAFRKIWQRRVPKSHVHGIHGTLFYGLDVKQPCYPTRRDEDAVNPDGTPLR